MCAYVTLVVTFVLEAAQISEHLFFIQKKQWQISIQISVDRIKGRKRQRKTYKAWYIGRTMDKDKQISKFQRDSS